MKGMPLNSAALPANLTAAAIPHSGVKEIAD